MVTLDEFHLDQEKTAQKLDDFQKWTRPTSKHTYSLKFETGAELLGNYAFHFDSCVSLSLTPASLTSIAIWELLDYSYELSRMKASHIFDRQNVI